MDYNFDVADKTLFVTRGANMLHVASIRVSSPLAKAINSLRQRIAALEAEKAERERQEPVGFQVRYKGERTWGTIITHRSPDSVELRECEIRDIYAHPLALRDPTDDECSRIAIEAGHRLHTEAARIAIGSAMFNAVRKGMTK